MPWIVTHTRYGILLDTVLMEVMNYNARGRCYRISLTKWA